MKMKTGAVIGIIVAVVLLIILIIAIVLLAKKGTNSSPNYTQAMKDEMDSISEGMNTKAKGKVTNGELTLYYNDAPTEGYYATYDNRDNSMFIGHFVGSTSKDGYNLSLGSPTEKIVGEKVETITDYGDLVDLSAVSDGNNKFKTSVKKTYSKSIFTDYNDTFELKSVQQTTN